MRIAQHVRALQGYVPGEQPRSRRVVKLNTNENPYPPSPKCAAALATFDTAALRRYPDPVFSELREVIARLNGTTIDRVFVGNGSDEILSLAARAFVEDDESIGSLDPSYSLYKTLAAIRNVKWIGLEAALPMALGPSRPKSLTSPSASLTSPLPSDVSLFLLTNPNAPTGEFREPKAVAAFAKKTRGVLLVDEAYADFARDNCMALATAPKNRNVIVMRTLSKSYSLAGLRVGYCVGPKDLIDALYKIKDSYNVDLLAQRLAIAALKDQPHMRGNVRKIVRTREATANALRSRGFDVIPSEANFLFVRPPKPHTAAALFAALKKRNIFVRYFPGPKTGDRLRITIGTEEEMRKLMKAICELVN